MYRHHTATVLNPPPGLEKLTIMDTLETSCKAVVAAEAVLLLMLLLLAAGLTAVLVPRLLLKTELRRRADIFGRPQGQQIIQQEVCGGVLSP